MKEADLGRAIMVEVCRRGDRLWRNNVGVGWVGKLAPGYPKDGRVLLLNARPLHAGLARGSADHIGIQRGSGRFISIETKRLTKLSDEQRSWLAMVLDLGGVAGVARSVEEAIKIVEEGR
jgi:hypothetical protein